MAALAARGGMAFLRTAKYMPGAFRAARAAFGTPARRRAAAAGAAKFLTWANRRKISRGYNAYAKRPLKAVFGRRVARSVNRFSRRGMKTYRKRTPKMARYAMANW